MYKLTATEDVIRLSDNAVVTPSTLDNTDSVTYKDWLSQGNTPDPADVYVETWIDKREARYKAEANPALIKALSIAQQDSLPIDYTEHDAIVAEIKTSIPKVV